jgi:hypothetical protein
MTWLLLIAGAFAVSWVLTQRQGHELTVQDERNRTLCDGSLYRLEQRTGGQAGLVTGARARTRR